MSRIPSSLQERPQPDREQRQEDDGQVVGDRRDDRHEVDQLGGPAPVRDVEHPDVAADQRPELPGALRVRAQRPPDAEQVRAEPERVAALDRAGRLDPADGRDPGRARPGFDGVGFGRAIRLARAKRDRAAIGHEQRIERVDEVGRLELDVEDVDPRDRARPASRRTHRARAARPRGRPGAGSRAPGSSKARPNAAPGRLTSTSSSGADMLWAPYRRSVVSIAVRIAGGQRPRATRRPGTG